ncbi:MAG: phosphonate C-P lyase system protein PhnH [Hyphomicrobiaceae bacterium]|nr:phosphonate C-P lyase system protein PhnH [Hyphomicrobiaceae bacterium]
MTMETELSPGFQEPVHGAQQTFRAVLDALSRPGIPVPLSGIEAAPDPMGPTLAAAALTLLDHETGVYLAPPLDIEAVKRYIAFHTGAPTVSEPADADFVIALADRDMPDILQLKTGCAEYPDQSATVLLGVRDFGSGEKVLLSGPGIAETQEFSPGNLDAGFWTTARQNHARFPLGVDFILCGPESVAGLPRSTSIAV